MKARSCPKVRSLGDGDRVLDIVDRYVVPIIHVELDDCTWHRFLCRRPRATLRSVCEGDGDPVPTPADLSLPWQLRWVQFSSSVVIIQYTKKRKRWELLTNPCLSTVLEANSR